MRIIHRKLLPTLASVAALLLTAGCAPDDSHVPGAENLVYNSELTSAFQKILDVRENDNRFLGLRTIVLFCESVPGNVQITATFKNSRKNLKVPLVSDKPCSETGVLVAAQARESRGTFKGQSDSFNVYSKQPYSLSIVEGEWKNALDATIGTFARNKSADTIIANEYAILLKDLGIRALTFKCDSSSKTVRYEAVYQQSQREGLTSIACPLLNDNSERLVTLVLPFSGIDPNSAFKVASVKGLDSVDIAKLVEDFLRVGRRRDSF